MKAKLLEVQPARETSAWAMFKADGELISGTVSRSREGSLQLASVHVPGPFRYWRRKGYRCLPVRVEPANARG